MLKALLLFLFAFLLLSAAQASDDLCSSRSSPTKMLNFYQKIVYAVAMTTGRGVQESKFLSKHYWSGAATEMRELSYWGLAHSEIFCRPQRRIANHNSLDTEDNEVDAIRHFVGATLLHYFYPDKALELLLAHEIKDGQALNASDLMDMRNNQFGDQFSQELRQKKAKLSVTEVATLAFEKSVHLLKSGQLKTLRTTETGPCHKLSEKSDTELNQLIQDHKQSFHQTIRKCEEKGIAFHSCGRQPGNSK